MPVQVPTINAIGTGCGPEGCGTSLTPMDVGIADTVGSAQIAQRPAASGDS
jgi:hypothetical protein